MFVHSLVRSRYKGRHGWRAPVELGDATPHYISYVIPLDDRGELGDEYTCEVVVIAGEGRMLQSRNLVRTGIDTFLLGISPDSKLWFHVRPIHKNAGKLPYVGTLHHDDFNLRFIEIEPDDVSQIDRLCEDQGVFIVGCDPEQHYSESRKTPGRSKELAN